MKLILTLALLGSTAAHAGVQFSNGGTNHVVKGVDGVLFTGTEAQALYKSLTGIEYNQEVFGVKSHIKLVNLSGSGMPITKIGIVCSQSEGKQVECYLAVLPKVKR